MFTRYISTSGRVYSVTELITKPIILCRGLIAKLWELPLRAKQNTAEYN